MPRRAIRRCCSQCPSPRAGWMWVSPRIVLAVRRGHDLWGGRGGLIAGTLSPPHRRPKRVFVAAQLGNFFCLYRLLPCRLRDEPSDRGATTSASLPPPGLLSCAQGRAARTVGSRKEKGVAGNCVFLLRTSEHSTLPLWDAFRLELPLTPFQRGRTIGPGACGTHEGRHVLMPVASTRHRGARAGVGCQSCEHRRPGWVP